MTGLTVPLLLLAFVVLTHFTFVNINIGLGFFSLILRWRSRPELEDAARRAFKFLVASEAVSGIYGTIITVVLAGLWPTLVNIVTIVLFIPLLISLLGIIFRLTSIVAYWYSWGKVKFGVHLGRWRSQVS